MKAIPGAALRYFFLALILFVFLFPLLIVLNTSLKTEQAFIRDTVGVTRTLRFQNFSSVWETLNIGANIFNSAFYTATVTALNLIMAVFLAFPIARNLFRHANKIYLLFMAGMFLPGGMIPLFRLILGLGLYNTRAGYILTMLSGGGVTLLFFIAYIKGLPRELDEAAAVDGCGYIRYVFMFLIPLMKPALASMAVLQAINVWNEVLGAVIYLSNSKLYPITRGLYAFKGDHSVKWTLLSAALIIVAAPMIILYVFLQKYIIDGIVAGGVKA